MGTIFQAVGLGMVVLLAGTIPRNVAFVANLRTYTDMPWAVPVIAVYLWFFWRYLGGAWPPESTRQFRRGNLRANRLSGRLWAWALVTGGLGIIALVIALRLVNRMVVLPDQDVSPLVGVPTVTAWSLLLVSAPVAGFIEEGAFRGYMQRPIEQRYGLTVAILITGTMFAVAHLDFTAILWPYYVAVAAIYGTVTYRTDSVWPAVVLHTSGNLYSNFDLLLHGRAEWQAPSRPDELIWATGVDATFASTVIVLVVVAVCVVWAQSRLARAAHEEISPMVVASAV